MERKRSVRLDLRFTPSEKKMLVENAKSLRLSMTDYITQLAMKIRPVDTKMLVDLIIAINRIGININQITRIANMNKNILQKDIDMLNINLAELQKLSRDIINIVTEPEDIDI